MPSAFPMRRWVLRFATVNCGRTHSARRCEWRQSGRDTGPPPLQPGWRTSNNAPQRREIPRFWCGSTSGGPRGSPAIANQMMVSGRALRKPPTDLVMFWNITPVITLSAPVVWWNPRGFAASVLCCGIHIRNRKVFRQGGLKSRRRFLRASRFLRIMWPMRCSLSHECAILDTGGLDFSPAVRIRDFMVAVWVRRDF